MSVLIKDMEMPKHCGECGIEWCDRWKKLIIAGMSIAKSRPSDCPLVPVPPHGRLIDVDEFEKENAYFWNRDFINPKYSETLADLVNAAPTIIEAEEGK